MKTSIGPHSRIIISRTDAIGDVILTLPMVVFLKKHFPQCHIVFLGRNYTKDIVSECKSVDEFISWDEISSDSARHLSGLHADVIFHVFPRKEIARAAHAARIPQRVGTSHRIFHWLHCNARPSFSRKNSELHEAQLNFKLLAGVGIHDVPTLDELIDMQLLRPSYVLKPEILNLIQTQKFNLILHPGSRGSAREWGIDRFSELIALLPAEEYNVFLTGTENEGVLFRNELAEPFSHVTDLSGKLTLSELLAFIEHCDALVAASTGPLHMAATLGIHAIGLYPPIRPMHPGRWAPIGRNVKVFVSEKDCSECRKTQMCSCMRDIEAIHVSDFIRQIGKEIRTKKL